MVRRIVSSTIFILVLALLGGKPAQANTPLTRAVVSSLRNQVRLLPSRKPARKARLSDVLQPGDGIVTSRRSLAELRFNDGSLARMGEQAVFRFIPKTRSFRLSNGTVLMLIPPGQGRTQVRTPNVTAGIRGSALMIRYDKVTDTSTVIALTNSQISVTNRDKSQTQVLAAGQAVVTVGDDIVDSYDVDLQELYRTSKLLRDLEMNNPDAEAEDEAIAQVREETLEGIQSQRRFLLGEGRDGSEEFRLSELNIDSVIADETGRPFGTALPGVEAESTSFPGRSIGVDGRFNEEDNGEQVVPAVPQPTATEPPVTTVVEDSQPIEELPQEFETPVIVESPAVEPPAAPVGAVDDLPGNDGIIGGDDIAGGDIDNGDTPISAVDDLPSDIPIFDETGALNPQSPEDGGDISPPTIEDLYPVTEAPDIDPGEFSPGDGDTPISEVDDLPSGIPSLDEVGELNPESPVDQGDISPPTMDDLHPVTETPDIDPGLDTADLSPIDGDTPISEADDLPSGIPSLEEVGELNPDSPGDQGDISPPTMDDLHPVTETPDMDPSLDGVDGEGGITVTVTVTVEGEQQSFEAIDDNAFQASPPEADTTVEPTPEDHGS